MTALWLFKQIFETSITNAHLSVIDYRKEKLIYLIEYSIFYAIENCF